MLLHVVKNVVVVVAETFDDDYMDSVLVVPLVKMARRMTMKSPAVVAVDEGDP